MEHCCGGCVVKAGAGVGNDVPGILQVGCHPHKTLDTGCTTRQSTTGTHPKCLEALWWGWSEPCRACAACLSPAHWLRVACALGCVSRVRCPSPARWVRVAGVGRCPAARPRLRRYVNDEPELEPWTMWIAKKLTTVMGLVMLSLNVLEHMSEIWLNAPPPTEEDIPDLLAEAIAGPDTGPTGDVGGAGPIDRPAINILPGPLHPASSDAALGNARGGDTSLARGIGSGAALGGGGATLGGTVAATLRAKDKSRRAEIRQTIRSWKNWVVIGLNLKKAYARWHEVWHFVGEAGGRGGAGGKAVEGACRRPIQRRRGICPLMPHPRANRRWCSVNRCWFTEPCHHSAPLGRGGGGTPPPPGPPPKRWGQIFFRAFGQTKIVSGAFAVHYLGPKISPASPKNPAPFWGRRGGGGGRRGHSAA